MKILNEKKNHSAPNWSTKVMCDASSQDKMKGCGSTLQLNQNDIFSVAVMIDGKPAIMFGYECPVCKLKRSIDAKVLPHHNFPDRNIFLKKKRADILRILMLTSSLEEISDDMIIPEEELSKWLKD